MRGDGVAGLKKRIPSSSCSQLTPRKSTMNSNIDLSDEFGENRLISRLNRRFCQLMGRFLRVPESWSKETKSHFKQHLARVNNLALTILLAGGLLVALIVMVLAIKLDSSVLFFIGLGVIPCIYVAQYVLSLFCSANLNLTFGPPIRLVSRLIPDVLTILGLLGCICALVIGYKVAIEAFSTSLQLGLIATGISLALIILALAGTCVAAQSESLLRIQIEDSGEQTPAEYLISLVLYLGRFQLALVPYQFLLFTLFIVGTVVYAGSSQILSTSPDPFSLISVFNTLGWGGALFCLAGISLLPITAHFFYLLVVTLADIGDALFSIARSSEQIAALSEEAMKEAREDQKSE